MSKSFETIRSEVTGVIVRRGKQTLFVLLACASLVVSSFGACLCPHHETDVEQTKLSCHSASHEKESVRTDSGAPKLQSLCVCAADSSPAIVNKSDRKKADGKSEVRAHSALQHFEPVVSILISDGAFYPDADPFQSGTHRTSAPSRAPPRL
jgi:hypothetical protein